MSNIYTILLLYDILTHDIVCNTLVFCIGDILYIESTILTINVSANMAVCYV